MASCSDLNQDIQFIENLKKRYKECIRMLNGLEKSLEKYLPEKSRRWVAEESEETYKLTSGLSLSGWPSLPEH